MNIGNWIKNHAIVVIAAVTVIGCIVVLFTSFGKLDSDDPKKPNDTRDDVSDNTELPNNTSNTLLDGTYHCRLMYNGKNVDSDLKNYANQLYNKMELPVDMDDEKINEFRQTINALNQFYIVKENNMVELRMPYSQKDELFFTYDIINNKVIPAIQLKPNQENIWNICLQSMHIQQTNNNFNFGNFMGTFILYNGMINNSNVDEKLVTENVKKLEQIGSLGDLVCDNTKPNTDNYSKYIKKYIGIGSEYASESYVELLENNEVMIKVNNCSGWTTYKGKYTITYDVENDQDMLYVTSLSVWNGYSSDELVEDLTFIFNTDGLYVVNGTLGFETFDCAVGKLLVAK